MFLPLRQSLALDDASPLEEFFALLIFCVLLWVEEKSICEIIGRDLWKKRIQMRLNFFCFAQKKCKCFREQQTGNVLPKNFISKKGFSRIVYVKQFQKEKNNNIQLSRRSISIWKRFFVLLSNEKIFMKGKKIYILFMSNIK